MNTSFQSSVRLDLNTSSSLSSSASSSGPLKIAKSCDRCRRRKIKCSGDKPSCTNCIKFGALCAYSPVAPRR
ncbi:hypothetical protein GQ42DRAFT_126563, partial [Ramicandelaber brevisporus]